MEIQLNGNARTIDPTWTVADLLAELRIENRYCAVECNLNVVPRECHAVHQLKDGDRIEIVTLVGGG